MTLKQALLARIARTGPITVAEYMTECLLHPDFGYYTNRDPFGVAGDFVTAPEISQMFGELIGLSLAQAWMNQGKQAPFTLAELGPGRGTLMADALRATRHIPGFHEAAKIVLVEVSSHLRGIQRETLADFDVTWIAQTTALPDQHLYLIANEFFDALPIRQFVRDQDLWRERHIGKDGDRLVFGFGPAQPQPALGHRLEDTKSGDLIEFSPALAPTLDTVGERIVAHGGAGLIIDYGDWGSLGDTLQAVMANERCDPLEAPGASDLSAHVDFEALALATPSRYSRVTPQGVFLDRLGITERANQLARSGSSAQVNDIVAAHRRLTHPDEMGNLFKVIGLYPDGQTPPPGLDA